jgi:peptidoglycan hydrolase-like protein with peptidoglycan-binding domain
MEYCGNCGEAAQGRYCRMCGMPVGAAADPAPAQAVSAGYGAYEAAYAPAPVTEATQTMAAVPAGYAMSAGPEPTQVMAPMPTPPTQPPTEFDSLFRSEDGAPGLHGQTQVLPPIVETDYRMQPPGAAPPGGYGGPEEEPEQRANRVVIFATLGAVIVAAGIIIALLLMGNQSNSGSGASASTTGQAKGVGAATSQAPGQITLPSNAATTPSAPASSSPATTAATTPPASTSAAFHGDSFPLGPGSKGSSVKWVQQRLQELGYYHGSVDGTFDQATALAVQQFQGAAGVTGDPASTVGQHTRLALTAAGSTPSLRFDSRSSDVSRLNQSLDLAEGASLSGSKYSMQTAEAVALYQQAVGLQPTGQVNAATWAKLQTGTLAD